MPELQTPSYTVRRSARAKRMTLRVLPGRGVEVVLPRGVPEARAHAFVQAKAGWLRRTMRKLAMEQSQTPLLPECISLQALDRRWTVRYGHGPSKTLRLLENTDSLQFLGTAKGHTAQEREKAHCVLLQNWLKAKARAHLPARVRSLEAETGLRCHGVQIRLQRTRWGSCSSRGNLSLNAAILFLDPDLARHVLLHELCHTRHLNHSPDFWQLLTSLDPQTRTRDAALNQAWRLAPAWVLA